MEKVLAGETSIRDSNFEVLPFKTREMNFVITVRDNSETGGGMTNDLISFNATDEAGPFLVSTEFSENEYHGLSNVLLEWDVANTNIAPVNCLSVDVLYSTDGGENFNITIASGLANDGSESIKLPNIATTQARIMVKATANVFFNVNDRNFTVVASDVDVPIAPVTLSGTRVGNTTVELSWMHEGDLEDGFIIERRLESATDFEEIGQATINATTYIDETVESNEAYVYRVAAFNATGNSVYTNLVTIDAIQETDILTFSLAEQTEISMINNTDHTVSIEVEFGTDVTSLTPDITLSEGATSVPVIGVAVDFTEPVTYTVTSEDGSLSQDWQVTVMVAEEALNTETDILTFSLVEQTKISMINNTDHTVSIEVEFGTDVTSLTPDITLSEGATSVLSVVQLLISLNL